MIQTCEHGEWVGFCPLCPEPQSPDLREGRMSTPTTVEAIRGHTDLAEAYWVAPGFVDKPQLGVIVTKEFLSDLLSENEKLRASAIGWRVVTDDHPSIGVLVIASDGEARWMDRRVKGMAMDFYLQNRRHVATHWHPVAELRALAQSPPAHQEQGGGK